jgi:hypothetical protein
VPADEVPWTTLTRRRLRKATRRALAWPRSVVAAPLARASARRLRRDPSLAKHAPANVLIVSVYRARNAALVGAVVDEGVKAGWTPRLWALDGVVPELAEFTVGSGPGSKCPLVNELVGADADRFDWVVVSDDDFAVVQGSLAGALAVAERAGLDLVQPSHVPRSFHTFPITTRRALSMARRTTFVESGPVFAARQPWASRILPYPKEFEMGFGIELEWLDRANEGARLGIVDAVAVRHLRPVGKTYAKPEEMDRLREQLRRRGLRSIGQTQHVTATWRPWQAAPAWTSTPAITPGADTRNHRARGR